jgi:hypothetical protein
MGSWHLHDLTAATGAPQASFRPAGYVFDAQGTQHVVYGGADGHVHELRWDTHGWHHHDLTAAIGAPLAGSNAAGYVFDAQDTQHVVYLGALIAPNTHTHVQELWRDINGWHHHDLSASTGAPDANGGTGPPAGYVFNAQDTQHVVYVSALDTHAHVQELWRDINGWHLHDLSAATGAPDAEVGPTGYMFDAQDTQHIVYVDLSIEAHVQELWRDINGWHLHDLSAATGAPPAGYAPLSGYVFDAQGTQHVVYLGTDLHIHELRWDTHGWHHHDLTAATGAPTPAQTVGSGPAGYVFDAQGTQHVVYTAGDSHVHELWRDINGWHHHDLSAATGAPPANSNQFTGPAGYVFDAQGTQHVIYIGEYPDLHVYELWWG